MVSYLDIIPRFFYMKKKKTEHLFRHVPSRIILSHKPSSVLIAQPPYPLIVFCYNYTRLYFIIIHYHYLSTNYRHS